MLPHAPNPQFTRRRKKSVRWIISRRACARWPRECFPQDSHSNCTAFSPQKMENGMCCNPIGTPLWNHGDPAKVSHPAMIWDPLYSRSSTWVRTIRIRSVGAIFISSDVQRKSQWHCNRLMFKYESTWESPTTTEESCDKKMCSLTQFLFRVCLPTSLHGLMIILRAFSVSFPFDSVWMRVSPNLHTSETSDSR